MNTPCQYVVCPDCKSYKAQNKLSCISSFLRGADRPDTEKVPDGYSGTDLAVRLAKYFFPTNQNGHQHFFAFLI